MIDVADLLAQLAELCGGVIRPVSDDGHDGLSFKIRLIEEPDGLH